MPKLNDICSIASGLVVNRYVDKKGQIKENLKAVITIKSIKSFNELDEEQFEWVYPIREIPSKYLAHNGDVIIRNSYPYDAVCLNIDRNEKIIIPSAFTILRLKQEEVTPMYLAIYLNSEEVKNYFNRETLQSTMKIIKSTVLKQVPVKIIAERDQVELVSLMKYMSKEVSIYQELTALKKELRDKVLSDKLKEYTDA